MRRHFRDHHRGRDRVLVAHIVAHHVAVALFKGEDVVVCPRGIPVVHKLCHELEARKGVLEVYAVLLAYRPCHRGGDYACHRAGVLGHRAGGAAGVDDVVQQQAAELVAGDDAVFAVGSAHHRAYAVGVGVGADDEITVHALCQIDREIEALGILGVRALDRREAAVNDHLLLNGVEVLYAEAAQRFGDELVAAAVERRVNYAQVVRDLFDDVLVNRLSHDVL